MRTFVALALLAVALPLTAQEPATPVTDTNPFFTEWTTPFGVPPFASIKPEHYLPAFREGMAQQRADVKAIREAQGAATFANTLEALESSGELLARVRGVFFNLLAADTSDALQEIARELAPQLSALRDDIYLDAALFARVKAVWDAREKLVLDPEQRTLLGNTYREFVRGGANLPAEGKERLRAINSDLSLLTLKFGDNVLADTNAYRLVIERKEDLAGLPESTVAAGAAAAEAAGLTGKWVYTLHAPSIWPFLQAADNRELRRQILTAYTTRGDHGDATDNKATLARIAALRVERAKLLGYPTHAAFVLEENMAKTPEAVYGLLEQVWRPALVVARREAEALREAITASGADHPLEPHDWRYFAERVKKARYDVDEEAVRPYFQLERVRDGAFWLAGRLWGLTFTERTDIPKYHQEVRTFEVKDADGSHLAVLMLDYHPRPSKRGGAWMDTYRDQWLRAGKDVRPIVVNVGNFSRATGDTPALLTLDEARTLFHEFGHGLHGLLARGRYRSLSGTAVPRDFVELPSQIMENWVLEPEVLAVYAKHWRTGAPIPAELVGKIKKSQQFNQGFATTEFIAAALLDMDWHTMTEAKEVDPTAFEKASLAKWGLPPEIYVRYRSSYFNHVFSGGYSAGYYSYTWSEVLDADAFGAFKEKGIFDPATARSFRVNILEKGQSEEPMTLYMRFRGRAPSVAPLLARRGLQ